MKLIIDIGHTKKFWKNASLLVASSIFSMALSVPSSTFGTEKNDDVPTHGVANSIPAIRLIYLNKLGVPFPCTPGKVCPNVMVDEYRLSFVSNATACNLRPVFIRSKFHPSIKGRIEFRILQTEHAEYVPCDPRVAERIYEVVIPNDVAKNFLELRTFRITNPEYLILRGSEQ